MKFSELDEASFEAGFMFALNLAGGANDIVDAKFVENLHAVARGDLNTLVPPLHDAIRSIEKDVGREVPEHLKRSLEKNLSNRSAQDAYNREAAGCILRMLGKIKSASETGPTSE